jgi:hypothetical protein
MAKIILSPETVLAKMFSCWKCCLFIEDWGGEGKTICLKILVGV